MAAPDPAFVRAHHVHYEVEPEEIAGKDRREVTGYRLRLFATHGESTLEGPTCERCVALRTELKAFAEGLDRPAGEDRAEVVTQAAPKVYESSEVPGADEVHVTLRVVCTTPDHRRAGRPEPCLAPVTRRLGELGVPRR